MHKESSVGLPIYLYKLSSINIYRSALTNESNGYFQLFYENANSLPYDNTSIYFSYKYKRLRYLFYQLQADVISLIES